ncbi:MAG: Txe/YoeB family addiction module toxin [Opitutales bacterium]
MSYELFYSNQAQRDARKLKRSNLKEKAEAILSIIERDPFGTPPPYEALLGNLKGCYSRRINIQHRIVYEVYEEERKVLILRMWTHYGE